MENTISLAGLFDEPVKMPSGLVVPKHSLEELVKSEAKKQRQEDNKASFFSKFALAQNMVAYGAREKPMGTPQAPILYEAARRSFIDAILIRARIDQTKRIWQKANEGKTKEVGFRVVHERHDDPDYKVSENDKERCREMELLISNPTPVEYTYLYPQNIRPHTRLKDLVGVLTRAELIIDRKVILKYKRRDGQGYAAFHWLPGESIKNVDESIRAWAQKNETGGKVMRDTISRMSYATGFDIAKASYVQMIDGMVTAAFTDDEISVHISNPSDQMNRWGYGESRLEMSLDISTSLLLAFSYNKEMFKTNYPEQILTVAGDFDKDGLAAFKQQILSEAGGPGNNWRLPVIPAGDAENFKIESVKLRESPKDMLFDTMIRMMCMLKCAAYGAHPSTINLDTDSGSGSGSLFAGDVSGEIEFSKEHGLIPSLTDMAEWLTSEIVKPRYDDLKIIIVGLKPEDEKQAVDIRATRASKWMTRNEARMEEGMDPIGDANDERNPFNYPCDVAVPNYINTFNMLNQQQEEGQQETEDEDVQKSFRHSSKMASNRSEPKYLKIKID